MKRKNNFKIDDKFTVIGIVKTLIFTVDNAFMQGGFIPVVHGINKEKGKQITINERFIERAIE